MIKKIFQFGMIAASAAMFVACSQPAQNETEETTEVEASEESTEKPEAPASPRVDVSGELNGVTVSINYGSPSVKGREVWGGLEEYGKVWRAGANETTAIEFSSDVVLGGQPVAAGKYGLFIIPNETGDWVVILNTQWSREDHGIWGAMGYSEENDVARVNVAPTWSEEVTERLEYTIADGNINFAWEKARLSIPVEAAPVQE